MELRQLRYFVAVAEDGSISRAARRVFLTQPALSRQIRALEESIGQCLFERQAHSVHLTPAGESLLPEARKLLRHADRVFELARAGGRRVRLRIGYAPSLAAGLLPGVVGTFSQTHPDARVELLDVSTVAMLAGVESGDLDLGISVHQDAETRGLTWIPLMRADWRLAVPRSHPLADRDRVSPAEALADPLFVFSRPDYPEYWQKISAWVRDHGLQLRVRGECDGVDSLMSAVESGLGAAMVATREGRLVPEGVALRPLEPAPEPLTVSAFHRDDRDGDNVLRVFVAEIARAAGTLDPE